MLVMRKCHWNRLLASMNYASSSTNTSYSTNTSSVEPQQYLSQTSITPNIESTNNTEMVSVGLFDTTDDIHTLVNQLLDAELPPAPVVSDARGITNLS